MIVKNVFNLLYSPQPEWQDISNQSRSVFQIYLRFILPMTLIPTVSAVIGSSYIGWGIVGEKLVKLTFENAMILSIVAFFALITAVAIVAHMISWMATTYGGNPTLSKSIALTAYSATPLYLVGVFALYPVLWIDTLLTLIAIAFSIKLLFTGVPIIMEIDKDRAFLFASSILTVCMMMLIGLLTITVLFWGFGLAPVFTQ